MWHMDGKISLWFSSQNNLASVFLTSRCHCTILNQTCRVVTDENSQQSNQALHFCYFASSELPMQLLPVYSSHGDRQGGRVSITPSPFSFLIRTGEKGAMKQLETLLTLRIPIHSSQNRLKTWNLVSIYVSYEISWFFSGRLLNRLMFCEKTTVQGPFPSHLEKAIAAVPATAKDYSHFRQV